MPKTKARTGEVVEFEIGVKNRAPFHVKADGWSFGDAYNTHAVFTLHGDVVFVVAHQKWDYIRQVGVEVANANPTT